MILFTAAWCTPCQQVKQYLQEAYEGVLAVKVVDIDNDPEGLATKHKIKGIPTLIDDDKRVSYADAIKEHLEKVAREC